MTSQPQFDAHGRGGSSSSFVKEERKSSPPSQSTKPLSIIKWVKGTKPQEGMWTICPECGGKMDWIDMGNPEEGAFFSCGDCNHEMSHNEEPCLLCHAQTGQVFNILLKEKPICHRCENAIVKQSVMGRYGPE